MIKGRDLILSLDGVAVAASNSCNISEKRDYIEVCSPTDGPAKSYVPGAYGWSGSVGMFVSTNMQLIRDAVRTGKKFKAKFVNDAGDVRMYGDCYIDSSSLTADAGSLAKGSVTLLGTGDVRDYDQQILSSSLSTRSVSDVVVYVDGDDWNLDQNQDSSVVVDMPTGQGIIRAVSEPVIVFIRRAPLNDVADALEVGETGIVKNNQLAMLNPGETYVFRSNGQIQVSALVHSYYEPDKYCLIGKL